MTEQRSEQPAMPPANSRRSGSDPRGLVLAVTGCAIAAGALLIASGFDWLRASIAMEPPLPEVSKAFTGGEVIDALVGIGILVGAAGLALLATRWPGRLAVAVLLIVVALLTVVSVGFFLYDGGRQMAWSWAQAYATPGSSTFPDHEVSPVPAVVAILGGLIAVFVGTFTILRARRWPVMGARYQRRTRPAAGNPASASATANQPASGHLSPGNHEAEMWSALERGEDPTLTSSDSRGQEVTEPPDHPVSDR